MINLYIFNEISPAAFYGIGTYIRELTESLIDSGINIFVVHLYSDKPKVILEDKDGVRHWFIPSPNTSNKTLSRKRLNELYYKNVVYFLQLLIKDTNALIFHLNYMHQQPLCEELRRFISCKIILVIHYFDWCFPLSGNTIRFRKLLSQNEDTPEDHFIFKTIQEEKEFLLITDKIICLCKSTEELLKKDYGIASDRLNVVYNGLSYNANEQICVETKRKEFRIPSNVPVILFVGRLDNIKGLEYALRAFRIVLNKLPTSKMLIVGNGLYDNYMKECEDIWMSIAFTGRLEKNKLYELYSIADIGVISSLYEQCSYVAIEMMMYGLPLVTSTAGGLREMVDEGVTGLLIPVVEHSVKVEIDSTLLAEKMLYLLQHPEERQRMGINARKRFELLYSAKMLRENMINYYRSLLIN